ncbi:Cell wall mannoprotein 1 [Pseudocercospora fuligena]|uniref:Cell wall mannoprotein 1 n=1 Tax=Pseudocercospora fuligena TaxID=685502 RepID=A0A8H6RDL5_9PEZI|nr:Cell wall mannoprotein 1 [Pseudocercospora fuligena]
MKFLINALLVSGALAADVYRRQSTADLGTSISGLGAKVEAVDKAVEAFNGDAQQAVAIQTAAKELTDAVNAGTEAAKGLPELKQEDALGLASPVQDLEKNINKTIGDLIEKKDVFVKAGLGGAVHEILEGQQKSASDFVDVLLGKLPAELKPVAQQLAAPVLDSVKQGVAAFAGLSGSVASAEAGLSGMGSSTPAPPTDSSSTTSEDTSSTSSMTGTAGGYGAPPPTNATMPPTYGGNMTNTTTPITPYTGAAPSTTAASAASAFGISAVVALVALVAY